MRQEEGKLYTLYSEIAAMPIRWLWEPYIPQAKVTLLQAESSEVVTDVLLNLISELSRNGDSPDGMGFGRANNILYQTSLSPENIKRRLEALGADCNRICFLQGIQPELLEDRLEDLEQAMKERRLQVIVIDAVGAYRTEALKYGTISLTGRKTVNRLIKLARENQSTVIITGLVRAGKETRSEFERSYFDIDVLSAARSILQIDRVKDSPDAYVLRQIKNNLAPEGDDIRFHVLPDGEVKWECKKKEASGIRNTWIIDSKKPSEIEDLPLPRRLINSLKRAGMDTFEKILAIEDKAAFLRIRNIGEKGYRQVIDVLEARGMNMSHLK